MPMSNATLPLLNATNSSFTNTIQVILTTKKQEALSTTKKLSTCLVEFGADYIGFDFSSMLSGTVSDCCNLCGNNPLCFAFSYHNSTTLCTLKGTVPEMKFRQVNESTIFGTIQLRT